MKSTHETTLYHQHIRQHQHRQPRKGLKTIRSDQNTSSISRVQKNRTSRCQLSKLICTLTSSSIVWLSLLSTSRTTLYVYNAGSSNTFFAEAFATSSRVSIGTPIINNSRLLRSCGNGECQPTGALGRLSTIGPMHKTTLFSSSYSNIALDKTNSNYTTKQHQHQQFLQPLSKSHQAELFKTYYEYCRIQSILQKSIVDVRLYSESDHLLQEHAIRCGYDNTNFTQFRSVLSEGPNARETLFLHNIGLVHYVVNSLLFSPLARSTSGSYSFSTSAPPRDGNKANTFMTTHLSKDDLIQEGVIGLSRAIDKFNPELNYAFSTYAVHWIRAGVRRCIYNGDELIRVPEHVSTAVRKLNKALMNGGGETRGTTEQFAMDSKILSQKTGLTTNMVREAAVVKERRQWSKRSGGYLALEDWMVSKRSENNPKLHYDDSTYTTGLDGLEREGVIQQLKETISPFLSLKEMQALSWRYGLLKEEQTKLRDYESEAEEDLFGPAGILSSADLKMKESATNVMSIVSATGRRRKKLTESPFNKIMKNAKKGGRWGEAMSFTEVAQQMRISGGYGRRLCSSALKKLTKAAEEGQLDPALFY